jgi:hypothetical protein
MRANDLAAVLRDDQGLALDDVVETGCSSSPTTPM